MKHHQEKGSAFKRIGIVTMLAAGLLCIMGFIQQVKSPKNLLISSIPALPRGFSHTERIRRMLHQEAPTLSPDVIHDVLSALYCSDQKHIEHNHIVTVIDYSLPSNQKRLWIFDLQAEKLLFHTYVSHGLKSGAFESQFFSNKYNSKASSIGVYQTAKTYYGRHGLSLQLEGLDKGFNDTASGRAIVMHGGWYVDEKFIKKYGRAGRSWGCPAVPENFSHAIINTLKNKSLFVMYYPSSRWLANSKFLNCHCVASRSAIEKDITSAQVNEPLEEILFADLNHNHKHDENKPIVVIEADHYEQLLHKKAPLTRMLRRQISDKEYIALNSTELALMKPYAHQFLFVVPEIKMSHGYYATEMRVVNLGKIVAIQSDGDTAGYTLLMEGRSPVPLRTAKHFIRWLGL